MKHRYQFDAVTRCPDCDDWEHTVSIELVTNKPVPFHVITDTVYRLGGLRVTIKDVLECAMKAFLDFKWDGIHVTTSHTLRGDATFLESATEGDLDLRF